MHSAYWHLLYKSNLKSGDHTESTKWKRIFFLHVVILTDVDWIKDILYLQCNSAQTCIHTTMNVILQQSLKDQNISFHNIIRFGPICSHI